MKIDLSKIKAVYNSLPKELKYPLFLIPFSIFCGKVYREQYRELEKQLELSHLDVEAIRNARLIEYLNSSIQHTKFYSDVAKKLKITKVVDVEQLFEFPILSKEEIQADLELFLDIRYKNRSYPVTTGGTTGSQTKLFLSNNCYASEWAFVNHYLSKNGVNVNSKRLCLRGVGGIQSSELLGSNPLYKELLLSPFRMNEESILKNINSIQKFNPEWIHGYPSSVREFATILDNLNIELKRIKHILLVSEKAYPDQIEVIQNAFNANILSFYGMTERVIFAPLEGNKYIPNQLYGVTEELNGELVGTGFINSATRLIRYKTGDMAEVTKKGNFVVEINELTGRWGKEYLVGHSGVKITMTALNTHCDALNRVKKYQFYQKIIGFCELLLVVDSSFTSEDKDTIGALFQNKVGGELSISCKIVSKIPLSKRGKHQFIISEVM
ncbi:hypothetical protein [Shewanella sp. MSW]|uniref:hypothetical protein n=1 Tax=Shewanella sp. MSW TaxID=2569536 RepID=UPI00118691C6|nr:hypothetical protein [Shewanella sp. MSW]TVP09752.1 hypothetical protein AYI96_14900 [Shewanella sp. MSW]